MYCEECGTKNAKDATFCVECGNRLVKEEKKKKKDKRPLTKKKKIILIICITILFILLVTLGGYLGWSWYQTTRTTGSTWGDTYYSYIVDSKEKKEKKNKFPEEATIEFIQVSDIKDPIMVVSHEKKKETYTDIYHINKDEVENVISIASSDVELLYEIETKKYNWYVHSSNDEKEEYTKVEEMIEKESPSANYTFDLDEKITVETVENEELSIPKVDTIFVKPDISINEIKYQDDMNNKELKDSMVEGVEKYQPTKEITTDKVKEEVEKEVEKVTKKQEELEKAQEEVKKKQEEEAMKITSSNIQTKIGTHLKWFSSAYLGVVYGWYKLFPYKDVSDTVTIPTPECNGAMIEEVTGVKSLNSLKKELANYVAESQISRFSFDYFTEYNNQVYWCNMGVGDGPAIDTTKAKVLSSENGSSKIELEEYNELSGYKSSTITLTVTYNKETAKYLITDWKVVNEY